MPLPLIHYLYPSKLSKYHHSNAWALVTGASDGIGKALCNELALHGFNIILHGRNESKLSRVHTELSVNYPKRSFRAVTCDATSFTASDIARVADLASDIPLAVLVNNVGGTAPLSSNFKHFEDTTPAEMESLFRLNVLFPLQLTRALLPVLERQSRPTLVLTYGSQSHVGQPFVAAYSGCKAALHAWSRALAAELHESHSSIDVLEVVVGGTYTQQLKKDPNMAPGLFMPTAEVMAQAILARVGQGHRSVVPYFWHKVQTGVLGVLPMGVADGIVAGILRPSVEARGGRVKSG
jgi:17beta-estradiol 17-dehydrogenase / very-long-chain 3-oxoacyl-CoA reductase